ncbi:hypothetical protein JTB14_002849 [Gonioctena quinquepunctata]|nr:hypothetical protein JTB14_002849 [Gonioctena quinquepunctata]
MLTPATTPSDPVRQVQITAPIQVTSSEKFNFSVPAATPAWRKRFERYMSISEQITRERQNRHPYVHHVQFQNQPTSYQEALDSFQKFFISRRNIIFESFKFNFMIQKPGESVNSFITCLHSLAEHCDYGELKEELIRDRIVVGMLDTRTSERLQLKETMTLQQCTLEAKQVTGYTEQRAFE